MRIMLYINGQVETMEVYSLIAKPNNCLYIPTTPCGLPIFIQNVRDTIQVAERLNTCGWVDLSKFHAEYVDRTYFQTASDDMERELEQLGFER